MFNKKNIFFLFLATFLICWIFFIRFSLLSIPSILLVTLLLVCSFAVLHLRYYRLMKKIEIESGDVEEKINPLSLELGAKGEYLKHLPQHSERLNFFKNLIEEFIKLQDSSSIYKFLSKEIISVFKGIDVFLIYTIEKDKLMLDSSYKSDPSHVLKYKEGDILDYWTLKHNQGLLIEDIAGDFRFDLERIESLRERVINSLIISPMSLGKNTVGLLRVESRQKNKFSFEDLRILSVVADLAAVVLDRAKIFKRVQELAIKDGMTGLYRRGYFMERLKEEISRALIVQGSIGIIMADIDFFKKINDKHGHVVGDLVLKKLSVILREVIGDAGNVISRFGGEEFIIFLVSSARDETARIAEVLRRKVEATPLMFRRQTIEFTISLGAASFPRDAKFLEDLISKADSALYEAKRKGRNQVCLAS